MEIEQNFFGLTTPKIFSNRDLMIDIRNEYDIFYGNFINPKIRPNLKGVPIFIDSSTVNGMEERFLHCVSMGDRRYYEKILPCTNLSYSAKCVPKCKKENSSFIFSNLNRVECQYRLSRVQWIHQIIKYANDGDSRITMWRYDKKDKSGKWYWSRYVRYRFEHVDYLIVFNELYDKVDKSKLNYLDFRTAYPIFKPVEGIELDKQSKKYRL